LRYAVFLYKNKGLYSRKRRRYSILFNLAIKNSFNKCPTRLKQGPPFNADATIKRFFKNSKIYKKLFATIRGSSE
jgi:hypothetical protein